MRFKIKVVLQKNNLFENLNFPKTNIQKHKVHKI